ncbi:MAG: hypothetical protein AAGI30_02125 [Planctomycetota bacterium]
MTAAVAAGAAGASAGCLGTRNFENENDRLRREVVEAGQTIAMLEGRLAEAESALSALGSTKAGMVDPRAVPRVVRLDVLTAVEHADSTAFVIARVRTLDGRGRFVQAVGDLTVRVIALPPTEGEPPVVLGERTLSPFDVRDAYRSSFTGTHYRVEIPTTGPLKNQTNVCVVQYVDGRTGAVVTVQDALTSADGLGN